MYTMGIFQTLADSCILFVSEVCLAEYTSVSISVKENCIIPIFRAFVMSVLLILLFHYLLNFSLSSVFHHDTRNDKFAGRLRRSQHSASTQLPSTSRLGYKLEWKFAMVVNDLGSCAPSFEDTVGFIIDTQDFVGANQLFHDI